MDWMMYPISLVVAVQTSSNSGAVIDKLGGSGILFTELLAADAGETAVISFSGRVKVHQEFTRDPDAVIHALRMLRIGRRRSTRAGRPAAGAGDAGWPAAGERRISS